MSDPTVLHSAASDEVTLEWALRHTSLPGAVALLATPRRYHVARMDEGRPRLRGAPAPLDDVFEARVFSGDAELRWLHIDDGRGRAVLLTEDATALPGSFAQRLAPLTAVDLHRGEYLLWGRAAKRHTGWTTLTTARIGALDVPADIPVGERALLVTREYVARDPDHGNAYIAEERLLHLEPVRHEDAL